MAECLTIEEEPGRLGDTDQILARGTLPPVAVPLLIAGLADGYVLPIDAPERSLSWNLNLAQYARHLAPSKHAISFFSLDPPNGFILAEPQQVAPK
jgi:hypothetical protein